MKTRFSLGKGIIGSNDRAFAFSSEGKYFTIAGGIGVWLYNVGSSPKSLLALLTGHTSRVSSVAFSPDGTKIVSAGLNIGAQLGKPETELEIAVFPHAGRASPGTCSKHG